MADRKTPTEEELIGYMTSLSNWGRWGADDQLGTLNLITPEKRAQAGRLIRDGVSVSCARPIIPEAAVPDVTGIPPLHYMINTGEVTPEKGNGYASDFLGIAFHGLTVTHLDSLCHQIWDGRMYNDRPAREVNVRERASSLSVDKVKDGVITRGVLLDIAKLKGKDYLDPGEPVFTDDLEAAEEAQGVRVEEGDALCLRFGWYKRRLEEGPIAGGVRPGLHAQTLPWLRERGVSILFADASQDVHPAPEYPNVSPPIHKVGIVYMGLWLIDAGNCEELVQVCERLGRWEFMFTVAPLVFKNATGSPINPVAIF